jgi:hypothetical protein
VIRFEDPDGKKVGNGSAFVVGEAERKAACIEQPSDNPPEVSVG